jgi:hypothetical protein
VYRVLSTLDNGEPRDHGVWPLHEAATLLRELRRMGRDDVHLQDVATGCYYC